VSYEQYIQTHIFAPLDMQHSFFSQAEARQQGMATGYQMRFDNPTPVDMPFPYAFEAAGGIISTAEDMAHYLIPYLNHGNYGDNTILSPAGMAHLWEPPSYIPLDEHSNYAMGWTIDAPYNIPGNDHSGSSGSFHSHMAVSPEAGWGIVILINADHLLLMTQPIELMTWGVMSLLLNQPVPENLPFTLILFVGTFIIVALQLLTLIWGLLRLRRWRHHLESRPRGVRRVLLRIALPVVFNLLVGYIFLVGLPQFAGLSFAALLLYIPDWGLGLLLGGLLTTGWLIWGIGAFVVLHDLRAVYSSRVGVPEISSQGVG
jgi:hypothetical protein